MANTSVHKGTLGSTRAGTRAAGQEDSDRGRGSVGTSQRLVVVEPRSLKVIAVEVLKEMEGAVVAELGAEQAEIFTHSIVVLTGFRVYGTQALGELLKYKVRAGSGVDGATP